MTAPRTATGGACRARHAVAGAVAATVALGATELVAGALPAAPSLVQSVASVVIDLAPIGVVRAAIDTLGTRDKPVLVAGVVLLSLLFGAGLALAARRRRWVAVLGLVAFGVLGAWAGARPPGTAAWRPALAALAGVLAGVATLAALAWRSAGPAAEVTTLPGAPASTPGPAGKATGGGAPSSDASGVPSALEVASRRSFLVGAGSLLAAGAAAAAGGRLLQSREQVSARRGVALPRLGETAGPAPGATDLDVPGLSPFITPTRDFYRVDTAIFPPGVDPRGWRLEIGGMVERPFQLSYEQLLAMPMEEHDVTLVCVSNEVGDRLTGNARWRGVRLDELLRRAGPRPEAAQLVARSVDGFSTGFPTALALDGRNALVAVGMNGSPLPDAHGFPARLVVPGLYGYTSACKWLQEIRLTRLQDFDPYWVQRGWAREGQMKTMARIDTPPPGRRLRPGRVPVAGVAWTHHVAVSKVEIQVDDGPWARARLGPGDQDTWRQWRTEWDASPGEHTLRARATDGQGQLQTATASQSFPSGATGWHTVRVTVAPA